MLRGTIKKVIVDRGFGFIMPDSGKTDVFFHCTALPNKSDIDGLTEGTAVEYETITTDEGKTRASKVVPQ